MQGFFEVEFKKDSLGDAGRISGVGNDKGSETNLLFRRGNSSTYLNIGAGTTSPRLVVMKIDYMSGNDNVELFVDPTLGTEPTTPTATTTSVIDLAFDGLSFACYPSASGEYTPTYVDEIRVGTSYADVTPSVPEPSSIILTVLGTFGLLAYAWRKRK
jgi:hypothetical protein